MIHWINLGWDALTTAGSTLALSLIVTIALGQARHKMWQGLSQINKHHMLWAWVSLFMVGFTDFYIWMVASGHITDARIF